MANDAPQEPLSQVLWTRPGFNAFFYLRIDGLNPQFSDYEIITDTNTADSKFVESKITDILSSHSIDDKFINLVVIGANELVENSFKHIYKFKGSDDGQTNQIYLGMDVHEEFIHFYVINKYVPADEKVILGKLEKNVSKEKFEDNDALKTRGSGLGFLMTKMASDMIYIHQTPYNSGFGFFKLRHSF